MGSSHAAARRISGAAPGRLRRPRRRRRRRGLWSELLRGQPALVSGLGLGGHRAVEHGFERLVARFAFVETQVIAKNQEFFPKTIERVEFVITKFSKFFEDAQYSLKNSKKAKLNIRPHANAFLEKMSKKFEIVIFTASLQYYADKVLSLLDPQGKFPIKNF